MGARYHVRIDGQGYMVRPGGYSRGVAGADGGWRRWEQGDWRRGDGQRVHEVSERWKRGYGVDVGTAGRVGLGAALESSRVTGWDTVGAMAPWKGKLYAVSPGSPEVWAFDGTTWALSYAAASAGLSCVGSAFGELMVGSASDGKVYAWDEGWYLKYNLSGFASRVDWIAAFGIYNAVDRKTVPRVAVATRDFAGLTAQLSFYTADGVQDAAVSCEDPRVEAMAVYRGRLYVATSDGSAGKLLAFDGNSASRQGVLQEVARWADDYPAGLCVFDGLLYLGMGRGGKLYASDGSSCWEAYGLEGQGAAGPGALRGMAVCGGKLYVGYAHPSQGASLLCKLPAVAMGGPGGGAASREGWHTASCAGVPGRVEAMGVYGGELYLARDAPGAATVYRRDPVACRTAGVLELSELDCGDPAAEKLLRRLTLAHTALAPGESLQVETSIDSGAWAVLGISDGEGSTGRSIDFAPGTTCRRVALRLTLGSGSATAGPSLTGVSLEYALVGVVKRRWEMEVRCEGVPGAMLRLLDGTTETRMGALLSAGLWAARVKGVVAFEDVDGAAYSVCFEELEEGSGGLAQERGGQTIAKCRLTEC
jgi:hypothetical protein